MNCYLKLKNHNLDAIVIPKVNSIKEVIIVDEFINSMPGVLKYYVLFNLIAKKI